MGFLSSYWGGLLGIGCEQTLVSKNFKAITCLCFAEIFCPVFIVFCYRRPTYFAVTVISDRRLYISSTRYVQKVSRILCFFKNYLLIHEYLFCHFQSNPHKILYTCANIFFQSSKHFKKIIFCDLVQLLLQCNLYLLNRSVVSSFHGPLQFREQEKVTGGQIWGIRWLRHY